MGAELKPLGGITRNVIGSEQSSNNGRNPGAMLEQPIPLQNSRYGNVDFLVGAIHNRNRGEVRQSQRVDGRLLGVEMRGDQGVKLWTSHQRYERYWRSPKLFRVFFHALFLQRYTIPFGKRLNKGFRIEESEPGFQIPAMAKTELGFSQQVTQIGVRDRNDSPALSILVYPVVRF